MFRLSLRAHAALVVFLLAFSWLAFHKSSPTRAQDPFGGDPFGGPVDPFGDPFGGGADPFGGDADPFGGGADPFGQPPPPAATEKQEVRAPRKVVKRRPS